jgi:hypothetical protein
MLRQIIAAGCSRPMAFWQWGAKVCTPMLARVIPTSRTTPRHSSVRLRGSSSIDHSGATSGKWACRLSTSASSSRGKIALGLPPPNAIRRTRALCGSRLATVAIS